MPPSKVMLRINPLTYMYAHVYTYIHTYMYTCAYTCQVLQMILVANACDVVFHVCILDESDVRDARYWMILLELSFFVLE